jgi:regulator of protease activity HflC (stomatin/prohibitin superfamily)
MRRQAGPSLAVAAALACASCTYATVEPGHRGLLFEPTGGGLHMDLLQPGRYKLGACFLACTQNRIVDYDVTYSTNVENVAAHLGDGLELNVRVSVIYRPILSEIYELETEIGPHYYDEIIAPEFRSATRKVIAEHGAADMLHANEKVEDEIENELRRRVVGKHFEIASVTIEGWVWPPEVTRWVHDAMAPACPAPAPAGSRSPP